MGRKLILPDSIKGEDFLKIMKKMPHGRNRIRLLAMHHVQSGKTLKEVAEIVHCHWITVQKWVKRFKEEGYDGLYESQRSGAPGKIGKQAESFVLNMLSNLSESTTGGYITGSQIHQIMMEQYQIKCCLSTVYNTIHKLQFSWITSRSMHPKTSLAVQEKYKKTLKVC